MFFNVLRTRSSFLRPIALTCFKNAQFASHSLSRPKKTKQNLYSSTIICLNRRFLSDLVDAAKFEAVCEETLESLCDYFEELIENSKKLRKGTDVTYGDGVLTVCLGEDHGTYVINRQSPNRQIWLSSPTSGPKRYDFVSKDSGYWIYKHDGMSLHQLLQSEIKQIVENEVDFSKCLHSLL